MTAHARRVATVAAGAAALLATGGLVERHDAVARLRYALQRAAPVMPSTVLVPAREVARGMPVLSVAAAEPDLYDRRFGILARPHRYGPAWERDATVTFFDQGRPRFSSGAGLRVHGGSSRLAPRPQSFRLVFRRRYGAAGIPGRLLFGKRHDHLVPRLVVHNDLRMTSAGMAWHLVNPLAYDIAEAAGGIVAATRPVRFFLNGRLQGVYVLSEHFDPRHYFVSHVGHPVRFHVPELESLWREIEEMQPLRMGAAGRLVDLDNLTRWFIGVVFCATGDAYQGPGQYRDPTRADASWFWVSWDMDQSFRSVELDSFRVTLERIGEARRGRVYYEPRAHILTTLLAEDPEYQEYFKRIWVNVMNHRITPAFLRERFEHYRDIALEYGVEDTAYLHQLEDFLARRPALVRAHAERWLNTGPSVRVRVETPGLVDGHAVSAGFEGWYFPGMAVSIDVPAGDRARLAAWIVNGERQPAGSEPLRLVLDRDVAVTPAWR